MDITSARMAEQAAGARLRGDLLKRLLSVCGVEVRDCLGIEVEPPGTLVVHEVVRQPGGGIAVAGDEPEQITHRLRIEWPK